MDMQPQPLPDLVAEGRRHGASVSEIARVAFDRYRGVPGYGTAAVAAEVRRQERAESVLRLVWQRGR